VSVTQIRVRAHLPADHRRELWGGGGVDVVEPWPAGGRRDREFRDCNSVTDDGGGCGRS
jgi:hypothetical protein